MFALANNVLGTLKADITGAAASLVMAPLAGTAFNLGPAPTDATTALTYGEPYGILTLTDRLDSSAAKIEHVLYTARAVEAGGAYTYSGLLRGQEGTAAQAWTAGGYILQQATKSVIAADTRHAVMRAQQGLVHRDGTVTWNGTTFKFAKFRAICVGRGKHFSSDGFIDIDMPANTTIAIGYGGAANVTAALGGWPLLVHTALYYEPNIGGSSVSLPNNFKVVGFSTDFVVPPHWIFIALCYFGNTGIEKNLSVGNGATFFQWRDVAGELLFLNGWVNYGPGTDPASFRKTSNGLVEIKGLVKSGTLSETMFTLPVGNRPAEQTYIPAISSNNFCYVIVNTNGNVVPVLGSNVWFSLAGLSFEAIN